MKSRFRPLCVAVAVFSLSGCDKPGPRAAATPAAVETENQLAEAHDSLQRQALEFETKTALMDKQLAEMQQSLKDRENVELQSKLEALNKQNEELRAQADAARRESDAIAERIAAKPTPNAPPQPEAQPDYSMFYEGLAPYGSWFEVNGYGYCWQPTISIAGWRPYLDGCWVWSDFGWAWQTNEPFGWATYHYGRWVNLSDYGWIWVPGSEWAPAWVAWRQSSDCVGWAPLPPEQGVCSGVYRDCDSRYGLGPASYVFINTNLFVSPSYIHVCAPVAQHARIFQCSVNVTQIVPRSGHRHAFVQQGGPPRAQMEHVCGLAVPQCPVQVLPAGQMPAKWRPHEHIEATAPVAKVELPAIAPGARVIRPEIKEHIQQPTRVSEFVSVPQHVATEIREQGNANAAAEQARMRAAAEQAAALQQRQQEEVQERLLAEKRATEQAATVQQQEALAAQQQRMAAEQTAAAENERARRQAEFVAMQQQQEIIARRAAEEQMLIKHETERRAHEIAQRQAEEHTRTQLEAAKHAQEMAKHQAEESARRQQETEMQRVQEQARRTAEEQQMRAKHETELQAQEMARRQAEEAGRRAQEHAQRQAEEQAHRAQEEARRTAAEAAHRAAGETSRNPSHPGRP